MHYIYGVCVKILRKPLHDCLLNVVTTNFRSAYREYRDFTWNSFKKATDFTKQIVLTAMRPFSSSIIEYIISLQKFST